MTTTKQPIRKGKTALEYSQIGASRCHETKRQIQATNFNLIICYLLSQEGQWVDRESILTNTKIKMSKGYLSLMLSHKDKFESLWKMIPFGYELQKEFFQKVEGKGQYFPYFRLVKVSVT